MATQRVEGINSSVKANGKLKIHLSDASYGEAVNRISQVARESDRTSIKELKTCRQSGLMVGIKFQNEQIVAWSSVWSEQLDPILRGVQKFFQDDDAVKVGEINGYFDPFVDNIVKIGTVDLDEEADVGNVEVAPSSVGKDEVTPSSVGNDEVGNCNSG